jgi:hypothetical protein
MNKSEFENTIGGKILADLRLELSRAIEVPNSLLPPALHSKRGGRTLASVQRLCGIKSEKVSQHKLDKAAKARNIERLAAQVASGQEFDYSNNERNDIQLHRNMMAMVSGMISSGLIDEDDLNDN